VTCGPRDILVVIHVAAIVSHSNQQHVNIGSVTSFKVSSPHLSLSAVDALREPERRLVTKYSCGTTDKRTPFDHFYRNEAHRKINSWA
jgi:hypothetical protein